MGRGGYTVGMAKALHALEYLGKARKRPVVGVCAVFGDDPFLKRRVVVRLRQEVLGEDDGEFSLTVFDGRTAALRDVVDEVSTRAMFGGRRLVVVDERRRRARHV